VGEEDKTRNRDGRADKATTKRVWNTDMVDGYIVGLKAGSFPSEMCRADKAAC
jgi:hypothetical protein